MAAYFVSVHQSKAERRREEKKRREELLEREFSTYNQLLVVHSTHNMVHEVDLCADSGCGEEFDSIAYRTHICPILFKDLHLIDSDVRAKFLELDKKVTRFEISRRAGPAQDDSDELLEIEEEYSELIECIVKLVQGYNNRFRAVGARDFP